MKKQSMLENLIEKYSKGLLLFSDIKSWFFVQQQYISFGGR